MTVDFKNQPYMKDIKNTTWKVSGEEWDAMLDFVGRAIENPESFPDALVLPWSPDKLTKFFTQERLRIIQVIRSKKPKTVSSLCRLLNRDKSAVSRDLAVLEGFGAIRLERHGRTARPILDKEVIVLPIAQKAQH